MNSNSTHTPLLSIIMPVYEAELHIQKVLDNVLMQTFQNYELLILDALSTDNTKAIVEKTQINNPVVRFISEKDNGIYDAMNKGIAAAKGDWLYFMGCDDMFFNETVLQSVSTYLTSSYDLIYGDVLWVPESVIESGRCTPAELINRNINHQRIFYRKELFKHYGGYNLQYKIASDHELNIRFFCNNSIKKNYIPVTVARYHSGGFSANRVDEIFWSNWKAIFNKSFAEHLPKKLMYEKLGWYCRYLITRHQYRKALPLFFDVLLHTMRPGFVKLTMEQYFKSLRKHAN